MNYSRRNNKGFLMKKIGIVNLGCPKNTVDLEVMLSFLGDYAITLNVQDADIILINTCAFISPARKESISAIKSVLEKKKDGAKVIISGCFVSKDLKFLTDKFKDIYAWVGVNDINNIQKAINEGGVFLSSKSYIYNNKQRAVLLNPYSAYVKISEGCNHKCSFCVIPAIKGKYRMGSKYQPFEIKIEAINQKLAVEHTICSIGSNHKCKRRFIKLDGVSVVKQ